MVSLYFFTQLFQIHIELSAEITLDNIQLFQEDFLSCILGIGFIFTISRSKCFFPYKASFEYLSFPSGVGSIIQAISIGVRSGICRFTSTLVFLIEYDIVSDELNKVLMYIVTRIGTDKA